LHSWLPWSGLGIGLFFMLLLAGYWHALQARTIHVEKLARALFQANQSLNTLIQASPLPIVAIDHEHGVTRWNPAAERMFGWSADEVLGRPLPTVPEAEQGEFMAEIANEF